MHDTTHQPPLAFEEPIVPEILIVLEVACLKAHQAPSMASPPATSKAASATKALPKASRYSQVNKFFHFCFLLFSSINQPTYLLFPLFNRLMARAQANTFGLQ